MGINLLCCRWKYVVPGCLLSCGLTACCAPMQCCCPNTVYEKYDGVYVRHGQGGKELWGGAVLGVMPDSKWHLTCLQTRWLAASRALQRSRGENQPSRGGPTLSALALPAGCSPARLLT